MNDDIQLRAEAAEQEVREILNSLKRHCKDDFVVITDGAIDWSRTIDEFVSFIKLDAANEQATLKAENERVTKEIRGFVKYLRFHENERIALNIKATIHKLESMLKV
jgi:ribosomal protein L31E